ncbi:MAG: ABC transporter ATP-binding protein [Candidatus Bathyarchaeia archaeon]
MENHVCLKVEDLVVKFKFKSSAVGKRQWMMAVNHVSFYLRRGETLALIGETGSGKTTIGRVITGLTQPTNGTIKFVEKTGREFYMDKGWPREVRRYIQMIFQDPFESLPPHMTVYEIVKEGIDVHKLAKSNDMKKKMVMDVLEAVGLPADRYMYKYPHQLSGGERQRVSIASAIVLKPKLIIADEPVTMLDASLRGSLLQLMVNLSHLYEISYIFIMHDLALTRYIANRMAVMYLGQLFELGKTEELISMPLHPYTKALLSVAPLKKDYRKERIVLKGEIPSPINIPKGCRFHPRCPYAFDNCSKIQPELFEVKPNHYVRCLMYENFKQ